MTLTEKIGCDGFVATKPVYGTEQREARVRYERHTWRMRMAAIRKMKGFIFTVSAIFFFFVTGRVVLGALLEVTFPGGWSATVEGAAGVRLDFSGTYFGSLQYEIQELPAGPVTVSEVMVDGDTAVIPVPVEDDRRVQDPRLFEMRILESEHYALGSWGVHTVVVEDNDAVWRGRYDTGGLSVRFDMEILRQGDVVTGFLMTDGYGIIPPKADGGAWPLTHIEFNEVRFLAEVEGIVIPPESSQLGVRLERAFRFEADKHIENEVVNPAGQIVGRATETLTAPQNQYLTQTLEGGSFMLERELAPAVLPELLLKPVE